VAGVRPARCPRASTVGPWAIKVAALLGFTSLTVVCVLYASPTVTGDAAASAADRPVAAPADHLSPTTQRPHRVVVPAAVASSPVPTPATIAPIAPVVVAKHVVVAQHVVVPPVVVAQHVVVPPVVGPAVVSTDDRCAVALAYLAAHAAPGFAHFCRPGSLTTALGASAAFTCVPGSEFACPDGVAEIIIAQPACAASYENEASNSYWDFSDGGVVHPGSVQGQRTWDPFGMCPSS
jgi:hypothetical protein